MGKKYIIELEDKPFHKEDGDFLYRVKGFNSLVFDMTGVGKLTPYTEPDLERVRKEGYEEGKKQAKVQAELDVCHDIEKVAKENYKAGLSDAWEAARKIVTMPNRDFINSDILDLDPGESIFTKYTASEAIEKIRQYEQEQEEIKVGDEVELKCGVRPAIYMQGTKGSDEIYLLFNDGSCGVHSKSEIVRKTGRHFPEIVTILENMRGEQDG